MKKNIALIVFAATIIAVLISLIFYYENMQEHATYYLEEFSQMIDNFIENRIGIVTEYSEISRFFDESHLNTLKAGPSDYLKGIKVKGLSIKYVTESDGSYSLLEIPISVLKIPSRDFVLKLVVNGKVVYSNDSSIIGTFDKVLDSGLLWKTKKTKFGFTVKVAPKNEVVFFDMVLSMAWGLVPLIAFVTLNHAYNEREKDLQRSTSALLSIISDMIFRIETGERVEYKPIETRHESLARIQQSIQELFSRYTEAIDGYKITTEQLENTMSQLEEMQSALEERNFLLINTLAETVELKDVGTGEHSKRVMQLSLGLAIKLNVIDPEELNAIKYGAILHDVGKIGIPDHILLKPGKLSLEEFEIMKSHTILGERVVSQIPGWELVADIVRHHHENIDGSGYPDGLTKETLSLRAQIVAIVDVYIALTEQRPYRNALNPSDALELMETMVGTKFDRELFEVFKEMISEKEFAQEALEKFEIDDSKGEIVS